MRGSYCLTDTDRDVLEAFANGCEDVEELAHKLGVSVNGAYKALAACRRRIGDVADSAILLHQLGFLEVIDGRMVLTGVDPRKARKN